MKWTIIIYFCVLVGCLLGIYIGLFLFVRMKKSQEQKRNVSTPPAEISQTKAEGISNSLKFFEEDNETLEKTSEASIPEKPEAVSSLRKRLPDRSVSWTELSCESQGQDILDFHMHNQKRQDEAYSCLFQNAAMEATQSQIFPLPDATPPQTPPMP